MMKFTLMIEGSASIIASILANLPEGASTPGVGQPAPIPAMPSMPGAGAAGDDGDDNGPVNASAPAVDGTGLPWDERIHAKTKTLKGDNTWTGRRGGPKGEELAAIEAELRARVASQPAPVPVPMPIPAPVPLPAPVPMPAVAMQPAPAPMPIPAPMAAPVPQPAPIPAPVPMPAPAPIPMPAPEAAPVAAPAPAPAPDAGGTLDFAQFMQHLSGQMSKRDAAGAPLVHADYLAGITKEISTAWAPHGVAGLTAITDIATNPQLIDYAMQLMQRDGKWS